VVKTQFLKKHWSLEDRNAVVAPAVSELQLPNLLFLSPTKWQETHQAHTIIPLQLLRQGHHLPQHAL
jgi:hypothetical protein